MYSQNDGETGDAHRGGAVWVGAGFGCGPVLAVAGDRVEFFANAFRGMRGACRFFCTHMPNFRTLTVPEKHWFIWPAFLIYTNTEILAKQTSCTMLQMATGSQTQFIGKPFKTGGSGGGKFHHEPVCQS